MLEQTDSTEANPWTLFSIGQCLIEAICSLVNDIQNNLTRKSGILGGNLPISMIVLAVSVLQDHC